MIKKSGQLLPELWGGIECSINRVGNAFYDQNDYSGHYIREEDIELCASLGIKALRYPVLWERIQPSMDSKPDWKWTAKELHKILNYQLTPIAGLLHHGSGPEYTNLSDPEFPRLLSEYAAKTAQRFPWLENYTIINEPLTTARFSGLYGVWYPHEKNDLSFSRMMINQAKAIVLSMQAIRKVNINAKLIQTEDLAKTYSTPLLNYQADFENARRWTTFDLLCSSIKPGDLMWNYFTWAGIDEAELYFFIENTCKPDVLGLNYYVTSERFLDNEYEKYPPHLHGTNTKHFYADIEAVRVGHGKESGFEMLVKEAWNRYKLPIAITEVHLNCYREQQVKWLHEIWNSSCRLTVENKIPVKAVTAWSLFGAYGWDKLLTEPKGNYEPGAFDLRAPSPRRTAIAHLISAIASGKTQTVPQIVEEGWWRREDRFYFNKRKAADDPHKRKLILLIGKRGTLANAFIRICNARGISCHAAGREDGNLFADGQIKKLVDNYKPWAVINAAGYVNVAEAERHTEECFNLNCILPQLLSAACMKHGLKYITFSSDLVFDGNTTEPYIETDITHPLNVYGMTKSVSEQMIAGTNASALIIRTSTFFGPWDQYNFLYTALESLKRNEIFNAASDMYFTPTYVPDLVHATLDLLWDDETGIRHLTNEGITTRAAFAIEIAHRFGLNAQLINSMRYSGMGTGMAMPLYSPMKSMKGALLPSLDNALRRFTDEIKKEPLMSFADDKIV
jgi:dTDP-4-dehydrorhamnose reductase